MLNKIVAFACVFILPLTLFAVQRDVAIIKEEIISPNLEDFDCHSSSLIEVSPGVLCAVWKGGQGKGFSNKEMKENVGIWISFFKDGHWSKANELVHSHNSICWNPVLHKSNSGALELFYRMGPNPREVISLLKRSFDGGLSWTAEEILPAGIVGPTKSKPVVDDKGNTICGSSVETGAPESQWKATACWIEILSNNQWSKYGPLEIPGKRFGCIEPALFFTLDGTLKMLCRDRSNRIGAEGWLWTAESKDKGKTWSELTKTDLPNPDSGIEVLQLSENKALLIYNHSHVNRYPLSVALSRDGGESWEFLFHIEEKSGEFPSAVIDSQGYLHVTYAWIPPGDNQRKIKHVVIDLR